MAACAREVQFTFGLFGRGVVDQLKREIQLCVYPPIVCPRRSQTTGVATMATPHAFTLARLNISK